MVGDTNIDLHDVKAVSYGRWRKQFINKSPRVKTIVITHEDGRQTRITIREKWEQRRRER